MQDWTGSSVKQIMMCILSWNSYPVLTGCILKFLLLPSYLNSFSFSFCNGHEGFFLKFYETNIRSYLNATFKSQNIFRINMLGGKVCVLFLFFFIEYFYMHLLNTHLSFAFIHLRYYLKKKSQRRDDLHFSAQWASVFVSCQYLINKPQKPSVYTIICQEGGGRKQPLVLEDVEIVESFPLNMCWNTHFGSEFRSESLQLGWCLLRAVASSCRWALLPSSRRLRTLIQTCKCLREAKDV